MKPTFKVSFALIFSAALGILSGLQRTDATAEKTDAILSSASSVIRLAEDFSGREPLPGYADLHIHMMAEYAFGGAWFHGSHTGRESVALKSCNGNSEILFGAHGNHADLSLHGVGEILGMIPGTSGDTGLHLGKQAGYPTYGGWPRWDTIAHQQVWEGFLEDAHEKGLNLIVLSAVNFKPLCTLMPKKNRIYDCEDMNAVERQIEAAHRFAKSHAWAEIALSGEHAREIISNGKLAIVLAIEVSDLFPTGDWREQLTHFYNLGVRSLQPVHQLDNRFAGAAPHHFIFKLMQIWRDVKTGDAGHAGFELDREGKNKKGLTSEGVDLVREMMRKHMLVDLAHLSERAVRDTYRVANEGLQPYPIYLSHAHVRELMKGKKAVEEKTSPDWVIELVKRSGGMMGLRTGPEDVKSYGKVPNDCAGSTKSFAQSYAYADQNLHVPVAFGSDLNGFIQQLRPRFGNSTETCGAAASASLRKKQQAAQTGRLGSAFDRSGFGQIGQIGDIIAELKNFGVDTANLERSADSFVRMWERADQWNGAPVERSLASESGLPNEFPKSRDN